MSDGVQAAYLAYLERARRLLGKRETGSYTKYRGRLVKKLSADEFAERWKAYSEAHGVYEQAMERGDTVNDAIQKLLEEHAAELLLFDL